ncbi:MAG: hypothetical protein JXE06_09795 [Coriobacteriia bacterium]|nr:hypothetical protein [Coriobacteriia bacterium]MBN2821716.1 hypothetical protein [Coriobacteriia bacterium]
MGEKKREDQNWVAFIAIGMMFIVLGMTQHTSAFYFVGITFLLVALTQKASANKKDDEE